MSQVRAAARLCCPKCGAELQPPRYGLEVDLDRNTARVGELVLPIRPTGAVILSVLAANFGRVVRQGKLISSIWGICEPEDSKNNLLVQICLVNKILPWLGWRVVSRRNVGYELVELEAKAA